MSRVGKKPIEIPQEVEVKIEGSIVKVKGPKGELSKEIWPEIKVEIKDNQIFVLPRVETSEGSSAKFWWEAYGASKKTKAVWGLARATLANMIKGVREGYEKKLEIEGLGFKAVVEGEGLKLFVGFSHPVMIEALKNIKFSVDKNVISVSGLDIELVSQVAAKIKRVRPPGIYKGKGIRYLGEQIRTKVGKKAITAAK